MVAKGHHFAGVELAAVVDADTGLGLPDFRAEERTFQLLTQLAGRSGREAPGRVIVQTFRPDDRAVTHAARHDVAGFLAGELERRAALRYPPFSTLIRIVCSSEQPGLALDAAAAIQSRLPGALGPAPLFRLRGRERAQVVVKAGDRRAAIDQVAAAVADVSPRRSSARSSPPTVSPPVRRITVVQRQRSCAPTPAECGWQGSGAVPLRLLRVRGAGGAR
jgi:primosomal protein N' (replication factor Y)